MVFGVDWPWSLRSNLTCKSKFIPFWACSYNNMSPVQARITKFEPEMHLNTVKIPIDFGRDKNSASISFLIVKAIHSAVCSIKLSGRHTTQTQTSEVSCTLQWSLSGHQHVCISYFQEHIKGQLKKTWNGRRSQHTQYWSYKPHLNFKPTWIFSRFYMCPSNDTLDKNKKSWCRHWGSTAKTGNLLGIKQT